MISQRRHVSAQDIPHFTRVIADSDFDGLCGAAILKKYHPEAEIIFTHAAQIRNGSMDDYINNQTVIVDLPFHQKCGWYLDHHQTNRPTEEQAVEFGQNGGIIDWQPTPSAARLVYERIKHYTDLTNFIDLMPFVDALDSGGITFQEFIEDGELLCFSRTLSQTESEYMLGIVNLLVEGATIEEIIALPEVEKKLTHQRENRKQLQQIVINNTKIINRLAICHLENTGHHSNGYLVTATIGDGVDACCIIHGYSDGNINDSNRPPLSASFYANSFIEHGQNRYDLSRLATRFDPNGGGHINACGCRIQEPGLEHNLAEWIDMWQHRETVLRLDN